MPRMKQLRTASIWCLSWPLRNPFKPSEPKGRHSILARRAYAGFGLPGVQYLGARQLMALAMELAMERRMFNTNGRPAWCGPMGPRLAIVRIVGITRH